MTQSWTTAQQETVMDYMVIGHSHELNDQMTQSWTTGPDDTVTDYRTT